MATLSTTKAAEAIRSAFGLELTCAVPAITGTYITRTGSTYEVCELPGGHHRLRGVDSPMHGAWFGRVLLGADQRGDRRLFLLEGDERPVASFLTALLV
jgi:hypothetical protein